MPRGRWRLKAARTSRTNAGGEREERDEEEDDVDDVVFEAKLGCDEEVGLVVDGAG